MVIILGTHKSKGSLSGLFTYVTNQVTLAIFRQAAPVRTPLRYVDASQGAFDPYDSVVTCVQRHGEIDLFDNYVTCVRPKRGLSLLFHINYTITNASNEYLKLLPQPLEFVRAGYAWSGSLDNRGANGYYWSSTPYTGSGVNAYYLGFYSSNVYRGYTNRAYGFSLRCVLAD